jgi:hypothetical protein
MYGFMTGKPGYLCYIVHAHNNINVQYSILSSMAIRTYCITFCLPFLIDINTLPIDERKNIFSMLQHRTLDFKRHRKFQNTPKIISVDNL